ncbi:D-tagatose-1,6-bisphosphate aldolase subunit GatY [Paraliobacillus sp. PM-2]|uniref:class II fructose-bisphosphate aldolase n=1 Tax=Paraliobacillus sp. PM-2 TaxID=1462524 RepID=UPI00061C1BE8|nr:ketose-bisphosphate aldolase [Paraliobacillus sp. PM-2]CQR46254.1 D-tagatose-1,6-bisphosphate aldolase subunit GatY [Paraliobacillus sp. PM-2]
MTLVNSTPMLREARKLGYGIVAFNVHSLDMLYSVAEAAAELDAPLIIQTTVGTVRNLGPKNIVATANAASEEYKIPMALHLDHCTDYDVLIQCIRAGYTSVMIDASMHTFNENVRRTNQVMDVAKYLDVNVEAELGKVGGVEDDIVVDEADAQKAVPSECAEFIKLTGVPTLAPAIGTAHGIYSGDPDIDFERIEKITNLVNAPLVLHGGSAIPDYDVKRCVSLGMSKMNVSTELKNAYSQAIKDHFEEAPNALDPRQYLTKAKQAAKDLAQSKIKLVGCQGKASEVQALYGNKNSIAH